MLKSFEKIISEQDIYNILRVALSHPTPTGRYESSAWIFDNTVDSVRVERTLTDFQSVASTELAYCPESVLTSR